jgi:hypothetical protein
MTDAEKHKAYRGREKQKIDEISSKLDELRTLMGAYKITLIKF